MSLCIRSLQAVTLYCFAGQIWSADQSLTPIPSNIQSHESVPTLKKRPHSHSTVGLKKRPHNTCNRYYVLCLYNT